jgi:hypothetical protein
MFGVAPAQQAAMPFEDRVRAHDQPQALQCRPRQSRQQRGEQRPIRRIERRPGARELALQHRDLVAQHKDFDVLLPLPYRQQPQHRERVTHREIRQPYHHKQPSCRTCHRDTRQS